MNLFAEMLRSPKGLVGLAVLAAYMLWQIWLQFAATDKIGSGFPPESNRVNVLVTLPFEPERFHVQVFQTFGRVSGTRDNTIEVRGVKRTDLVDIARPYWVRRVDPLP